LVYAIIDYLEEVGAHYDLLGIAGIEACVLWDNRNEYAKRFYDKTIEANVGREIALKNAQYMDMQIFLRHNDQRSAADPKLEPLAYAIKGNKLLKDGLDRLNLIMASRSGDFFYFYACGTGSSNASVGQTKLDSEIARVDIRRDGLLDAFGNTLFQRARFATGIPSNTIREFGACDTAEDPSTFMWRAVLPEEDKLEHTQNATWFSGSHFLVSYSR
jgi:hypothetical protein